MPGDSTHDLQFRDDLVTKRFRSWQRGEPRHEWQALTLLAEHAPGLAPHPLRADLDAEPPTVVMTRLPGTPLRGTRTTSTQITAMARAVERLHAVAPPDLPWTATHPAVVASRYREATLPRSVLHSDPVVDRAWASGLAWLRQSRVGDTRAAPVLGHGDGNLANYLWDGSRVQLVDFEDSGRSDRAHELAEIVEHVSAWVDGTFDVDLFLRSFALDAVETARLRECRRFNALVWLHILGSQEPASARNPPGTLRRQAARVLDLLAS